MKKSKLWIPLLTISGATAVVAPIMTSCSQGETWANHFQLESGEKQVEISSPTISGQLTYVFTTNEVFTEDEAKLIEPVAVITSSNSYITVQRCWKQSYDLDTKTMTVVISYAVNPEAYEYKEDKEGKVLPNEVVKFNLKIHNGSWYQIIDKSTDPIFSITAKRNSKPAI